MPVPNLIGAVRVTVKPIDRSTTPYDVDAREPVRSARYKTSLTIDAQIVLRQNSRSKTAFEGLAATITGYVLVRRKDLTKKNWTPKTGDCLTAFGSKTTNLFVDQAIGTGHWGDQNGETLARVFFADRAPELREPNFI